MTNETNSNLAPVSDLDMYLMYPVSDTIKVGQEFLSPWRDELKGRERYKVVVIWDYNMGLDLYGISEHPWGRNMHKSLYSTFYTIDRKVNFIAVAIDIYNNA
jgi:hypothetical protein